MNQREVRDLQIRSCKCGLLAVVFLIAASCMASAQEQQVSHPSKATTGLPETPVNEEYRVYEAVLKLMDTIPKQDPHVAIYERTLSTRCALRDESPIFAKGCSFLWVKPDTDQDVERNLRSRFHGLSHTTWENFKAANATSVTLHDPITAPWKHRFTGRYERPSTSTGAPEIPTSVSTADADAPETPESSPSTPTATAPETPVPSESADEWASPDMTIYLSRVGFDKKRTEALVYVLVFSYVGSLATTGDYLRFRLGADKQWTLAGRVSYLKQDSSITASLLPSSELK